ncbi:MAG: SUF system Fe-S cluster assembly regulator [Gemmatimonas sp.]
MIRLSRLADYGVVLMTRMAQDAHHPGDGGECLGVHTAVGLAECTGIPTPTVSKVLATLCRQGVLKSVRGAHGGYTLTTAPRQITVAQIIAAIDGPIALTQCIEDGPGACGVENLCLTRRGWKLINEAVSSALQGVTLADIVDAPMFPEIPAAAPAANAPAPNRKPAE